MELFENIYSRAVERKAGKKNLSLLLQHPKNSDELNSLSNDRVLSAMTKKIFQSGFVWAVVEKKWHNFEDVFWNFDLEKLVLMPDEMLERKATDPAIIRNFKKVQTIRNNAMMLKTISDEFGSVGQWLANWPSDNIIGLWAYLKKHGDRLGGNTGPYALRVLGKDTFLLSRDVEAYFRANKLIEGGISSKRSLLAIQETFNQWHQESQLSFQEMSQIVAYSVGDNFIPANTDH